MNGTERAALLQHGVTYPTIQTLEAAGYNTLAALAPLKRKQLATVDGLNEIEARSIVRAVGRLIDVGYRTE